MDRVERLREKAHAYHRGGLHCAEAVSLAVVEEYAPERRGALPRAASALGGGVGRTHRDICGALSGAFLAVGLVLGRDEPGADWGEAARVAAELRGRFLERHPGTSCHELLASFGPQENMSRCKRLSGEVAAMLAELLEESQDQPAEKMTACSC